MLSNLPTDIKAEALLSYFPKGSRTISLAGSHKRNAYEDFSSITADEAGILNLAISRKGLYDILPESLFHPIDRFGNIPANEYQDRIKEEIEQQQIEEDNARKFFSGFDRFLLELSGIVSHIKESYSDNSIIADIIADSLPNKYMSNRFVRRTKCFLPLCRQIRGDKTLLACMMRYVLLDEGLVLVSTDETKSFTDVNPRYNSTLDIAATDDEKVYLGNEFDENVTVFNIAYWNDKECNKNFPVFISEMEVYQQFINDFFIGIESMAVFKISTDCLPVRLSDNMTYNYLDYNTNF